MSRGLSKSTDTVCPLEVSQESAKKALISQTGLGFSRKRRFIEAEDFSGRIRKGRNFPDFV
ncbi:MAG: hypothetical protein HY268_24570 [Deltaproteobacteria bacterium]|nr:hypothetical protein [Deltaproteobacteria bacterium]